MNRVMLAPNWPLPPSVLKPHQQEVYEKATKGRVCLLTGGPGTGKTYITGAVLHHLANTVGTGALIVCAPTGKAATRVTDAMRQHGLNLNATTIHRALGVARNGHDGKGWTFKHGPSCPLPATHVVVDEASMLNTDLAASLLVACKPGTHIMFVGDTGQLPPVGHGAVLRDLLKAGLPAGELTEIIRNDGRIVQACKRIRQGKSYETSSKLNREKGENLLHKEKPTAVQSARMMESFLDTCPYDPIWECQVLCSLNKGTPVAREELNSRLQDQLNPTGIKAKATPFREGDKVMCLSNGLYPAGNGDGNLMGSDITEFLANGEIGRVLHVDKAEAVINFDAPWRQVVLRGRWLEEFVLAYAITVHKSQGSQWPAIIYMSDDNPRARFVGSRELIYTAISRASKLAITIGKQNTINRDCRTEMLTRRKTFLTELLRL